MITPPNISAIYLANFHVDMRKSINGLSLLIVQEFDCNPADGSIYVFCNRARNKIKILYFDRNGFALWYKRLEKGRFQFFSNNKPGKMRVNEEQLRWLLDGLDFISLRGYPRLSFDTFC